MLQKIRIRVTSILLNGIMEIPHRLDLYELLYRTSSRIVRVVAASGLSQEFQIVLPTEVKIKNNTSSVYSRLYGTSIAG